MEDKTEINETAIVNTTETHVDPMIAMIDKVCSNSDFDTEKMQAIINMRNDEIARQAKIEYNRAFSRMQNELPKIVSVHKNDQTKSNYAKIEDINKQVLPILKEHGFGISFKVLSQDEKGVTVRAVLLHESGHEDSTDLFMPYDKSGIAGKVNKTAVHATGSTVTYAKRYAMCMILNISTGDDNDGNNSVGGTLISDEQLEELSRLVDCEEVNTPKFMRYYKIRSLGELPASKYEHAVQSIQNTIASAKKGASNGSS